MNLKKAGLLLVLLTALAVFFVADLGRFLDLQTLRQGQDQLAALRAEHPLALAGAYFGLYVLATALSLPGAAVITLAGGAVFGLWWGTLLVSLIGLILSSTSTSASRASNTIVSPTDV